jgi:hypothetical protein
VSVIPISNMVVGPRSQNPWQLASPRSSVAAGGRGASAVGVDESGVLAPAAFRARRLTQAGFAFYSTGRKCSAAQVSPFIRHIIVPDMHQSARFV